MKSPLILYWSIDKNLDRIYWNPRKMLNLLNVRQGVIVGLFRVSLVIERGPTVYWEYVLELLWEICLL